VKLLKMELQVNRQQIHESKKRCSLLESQNLELMERIKLQKSSDLQAQLEEANRKLSMTAKSGDERVLALEGSLKETEDSLREQKKMSEKQALDLDEALSALRALHSAVCKEGPRHNERSHDMYVSASGVDLMQSTPAADTHLSSASTPGSCAHAPMSWEAKAPPVLGGLGIALGTATVSVKGKQKKLVQVTQLATSGPAAKAGVKVGDLLVEVDGRDVTNLDVTQVKGTTKGPPGSPMKLKMQRGGSVFETMLERSGGTGTSMASVSDASSMLGNTSGVVGKELTASERGKEGMEAAMALHEELVRLRAGLATMVGELDKAREKQKSTEGIKEELTSTSSRSAEFTQEATDFQAQVEEAFFVSLSVCGVYLCVSVPAPFSVNVGVCRCLCRCLCQSVSVSK